MLQRRYEGDVLAKEPWSQGYYRISLDSSLYLSLSLSKSKPDRPLIF